MRAIRYVLLALLAGLFFVLCLYVGVVYGTRGYVYRQTTALPHAQVALVLGASVMQDGTLSPVLQARADAAVALYRSNIVDKVLVTGDNSEVSHNEVNPVGKYLVSHGVPKRDIFLDHAGFDTYSSMYRARDVFGVQSMVIASQEFHLPRALFAARSLGLAAYGLATPDEGLFLYNWAREVPATTKVMWDLVTLRAPKFLGSPVNLAEDGSPTWADSTTGRPGTI